MLIMQDNIENSPYSGIIELSWPGKNNPLSFTRGKWIMNDHSPNTLHRALLYDSLLGDGNDVMGYAVKSDQLSALLALKPFVSSKLQMVYFDAPRLNVFQPVSASGYSTATWLNLLRQTAINAIPLLSKDGFFVLHTDEEMSHYGRMVLEEVFGKNHYVGTFAWQKQYAPQNDLNIPTDVLDYITVFSKQTTDLLPKIGPLVTPKDLKDDGDFRGVYIDGHKGARSGSEASKFKVNTSPYHWEIIESNFPNGRYHFDPILGSLYFETVEETGNFSVKVKVTDKKGHSDVKEICWTVRESEGINDTYQIHNRIWWLLKDDNDINTDGSIQIIDLPTEETTAIKGQEFSIVLRAQGGDIFTMKSAAPGQGRYWEFGKRTLIEGIARAKASFGDSGTALPSIKKFFNRDNARKRQSVINFLPWYDFGHTQDATQHCKALLESGLTDGTVNMMAKPQRLIAYLVSLFAPRKNDWVLAIGDSNGVMASVANKLNRKFIHIVGGTDDNLMTWEQTASKRIISASQNKDTEDIAANDALAEEHPHKGKLVVLRLSDSYLMKGNLDGNITPFFDSNESIDDFYAGLIGGIKYDSNKETAYIGIDDRKIVVAEDVDAISVDAICRQFPNNKIHIVYESIDEFFKTPKNVSLLRAPFDLI